MSPPGYANPSLRVLYLHHYGPFGGASRSLLELISNFPEGEIEPRLLTPRGQFAEIMAERGVPIVTGPVSLFDHMRYTYYRGARWLVLLRELALLPSMYLAMRKAARRWPDTDLVHVNEATMLPSIVLARWIFRRPIVLHVRSVVRVASGWRDRWLARLLTRDVTKVIAIDENVRASLPADLPVEVIHNGLTPPPEDEADSATAGGRPFTVAMVGNLLRVKGCLEFVQAAALCRDRGLDVHFVFVGQSARPPTGLQQLVLRQLGLSQEVEPELRAFIAANRLEGRVEFRGFTLDLAKVYRSIDVICFPSHFDAPGRPIFEAAFFGVPAIAAITEPRRDTIVDGETGLVIRPRDAPALAGAIERLRGDPEKRRRLGVNARRLAREEFDAHKNACRVVAVYRAVLRERSATEPPPTWE